MPRRKDVERLDSICHNIFPVLVEKIFQRVEDTVGKLFDGKESQRVINYHIDLFIEKLQEVWFTNTPRCFHNEFARKTSLLKTNTLKKQLTF